LIQVQDLAGLLRFPRQGRVQVGATGQRGEQAARAHQLVHHRSRLRRVQPAAAELIERCKGGPIRVQRRQRVTGESVRGGHPLGVRRGQPQVLRRTDTTGLVADAARAGRDLQFARIDGQERIFQAVGPRGLHGRRDAADHRIQPRRDASGSAGVDQVTQSIDVHDGSSSGADGRCHNHMQLLHYYRMIFQIVSSN